MIVGGVGIDAAMRRIGTFLAILFAVGGAAFAVSGSVGRAVTLLGAGVVALMLAASDSVIENDARIDLERHLH